MKTVSQVPFRIDTFKSLNSEKDSEEGVINYQVGGYISTEDIDKQNEEIIQKGIDFHTYANHRRLKWEHSPSAKANIGFAEDIQLRKGGKTYMLARIYATPGTPQYDTAAEAVGDIKNLLAYNKQYPNKPKDLGFSVEGGKLAKSGTKVTKSIVTNVVLTTCPINPGAVVDFFKSFIAGSEVLPMTGTEALRPEHLDGHTKNIKNKMNNLKSKEDAVSFYKSQGKSEEEAQTLAETWLKENTSRMAISKSINDAVDKLEKAIVDNGSTVTRLESMNVETMSKSLTGSMTPDSENKINPANVMAEAVQLQVQLTKAQLAGFADLAKSNSINLEAIKDSMLLMKSFHESMNEVKDQNAAVLEANDHLAKEIGKIDTSVSTENLDKEEIAAKEEVKAGEGDVKFTHNQVIEALQKSSMQAYDKGDRGLASQFDRQLITAQAYGYNLAAEGFPAEIKSTVENFYK